MEPEESARHQRLRETSTIGDPARTRECGLPGLLNFSPTLPPMLPPLPVVALVSGNPMEDKMFAKAAVEGGLELAAPAVAAGAVAAGAVAALLVPPENPKPPPPTADGLLLLLPTEAASLYDDPGPPPPSWLGGGVKAFESGGVFPQAECSPADGAPPP